MTLVFDAMSREQLAQMRDGPSVDNATFVHSGGDLFLNTTDNTTEINATLSPSFTAIVTTMTRDVAGYFTGPPIAVEMSTAFALQSKASHSSTPVIVGSVVILPIALAIIALLVWKWVRRRKQQTQPMADTDRVPVHDLAGLTSNIVLERFQSQSTLRPSRMPLSRSSSSQSDSQPPTPSAALPGEVYISSRTDTPLQPFKARSRQADWEISGSDIHSDLSTEYSVDTEEHSPKLCRRASVMSHHSLTGVQKQAWKKPDHDGITQRSANVSSSPPLEIPPFIKQTTMSKRPSFLFLDDAYHQPVVLQRGTLEAVSSLQHVEKEHFDLLHIRPSKMPLHFDLMYNNGSITFSPSSSFSAFPPYYVHAGRTLEPRHLLPCNHLFHFLSVPITIQPLTDQAPADVRFRLDQTLMCHIRPLLAAESQLAVVLLHLSNFESRAWSVTAVDGDKVWSDAEGVPRRIHTELLSDFGSYIIAAMPRCLLSSDLCTNGIPTRCAAFEQHALALVNHGNGGPTATGGNGSSTASNAGAPESAASGSSASGVHRGNGAANRPSGNGSAGANPTGVTVAGQSDLEATPKHIRFLVYTPRGPLQDYDSNEWSMAIYAVQREDQAAVAIITEKEAKKNFFRHTTSPDSRLGVTYNDVIILTLTTVPKKSKHYELSPGDQLGFSLDCIENAPNNRASVRVEQTKGVESSPDLVISFHASAVPRVAAIDARSSNLATFDSTFSYKTEQDVTLPEAPGREVEAQQESTNGDTAPWMNRVESRPPSADELHPPTIPRQSSWVSQGGSLDSWTAGQLALHRAGSPSSSSDFSTHRDRVVCPTTKGAFAIHSPSAASLSSQSTFESNQTSV